MIKIIDDKVEFAGTLKQLSFEFIELIFEFNQMLLREGYTEDESFELIRNCGALAFMSEEEIEEYLKYVLKELK